MSGENFSESYKKDERYHHNYTFTKKKTTVVEIVELYNKRLYKKLQIFKHRKVANKW